MEVGSIAGIPWGNKNPLAREQLKTKGNGLEFQCHGKYEGEVVQDFIIWFLPSRKDARKFDKGKLCRCISG